MATGDPDLEGVEKDADAVEEKYGSFADVYAKTRSEAAQTAGDEKARKHWQRVATALQEDGDQ